MKLFLNITLIMLLSLSTYAQGLQATADNYQLITTMTEKYQSDYYSARGICNSKLLQYEQSIVAAINKRDTVLFNGVDPLIQCSEAQISAGISGSIDSLTGETKIAITHGVYCLRRPLHEQSTLRTFAECQIKPTDYCQSEKFLNELKKINEIVVGRPENSQKCQW